MKTTPDTFAANASLAVSAPVPHDDGPASRGRNTPGGNFIVLPGGANIKAQIQPAPESGIPPSLERLREELVKLTPKQRRLLFESVTRHRIRPDYRQHTYISTAEACHMLGIAEKTLYNAIADGRVHRKGHGKFSLPQAELLRAFYRGK